MNTEKKQWIAPVATEIEVNGGSIFHPFIEDYNFTTTTQSS